VVVCSQQITGMTGIAVAWSCTHVKWLHCCGSAVGKSAACLWQGDIEHNLAGTRQSPTTIGRSGFITEESTDCSVKMMQSPLQ
jgi:hypothetical protein